MFNHVLVIFFKILFFTVFFGLSIINGSFFYAQSLIPLDEKQYLDSLQDISTSKYKTDRVDSFYLLANYYQVKNPTLARNYLNTGKKMGLQDRIYDAKYYFYYGQILASQQDGTASDMFQRCITILDKIKPERSRDGLLALAWYNLGVAQKNKEDTHI